MKKRAIDIFLKHVVKRRGCWKWRGAKTSGPWAGYGHFYARGVHYYAHRFSYQHHVGHIRGALLVLHKCDNPECSNPKHLFLGTNADNFNDMRKKGRWVPPPVRKGERHHSAKLTARKVRMLRRLAEKGTSFTALGKLFGISDTVAGKIAKGKLWRHLF